MRVIGLGTKDDADYAVDFVTSTGTYSFPMYWDETKSAWVPFGIVTQPAAVLLSPTGEVIESWHSMFPVDKVLQLAAAGMRWGLLPVVIRMIQVLQVAHDVGGGTRAEATCERPLCDASSMARRSRSPIAGARSHC